MSCTQQLCSTLTPSNRGKIRPGQTPVDVQAAGSTPLLEGTLPVVCVECGVAAMLKLTPRVYVGILFQRCRLQRRAMPGQDLYPVTISTNLRRRHHQAPDIGAFYSLQRLDTRH